MAAASRSSGVPPELPIPAYTGALPIHAQREAIIELVRRHPVVVIAGETGSGKTTQLPKFLIECGLGSRARIGCTQPRRVAALSVAERIAEELGVTFGQEVGAKIRFTDDTSRRTRIKVMTDGILLNELQDDPRLSEYDALIIDEAHERSLNIDFILGHLRRMSRQRPDLKLVITSATIDTETFSRAFDNAPVLEVSGRTYPVETRYRPLDAALEESGDLTNIEAAVQVTDEIIRGNTPGDILIFLPGERDITELGRKLKQGVGRTCDVLPLFGRLAASDQKRIFQTGARRRIILSTNIAETSLTVPGIRFVIDSGLARVSRYSPHSRTQRLPIEKIAQSSANQRKGRCGRVSDGVCYRLYSENDFLERPEFTIPEIKRANLASVILRMMAYRLGEIEQFPFIEPPESSAISGGYRQLLELGAVNRIQNSDTQSGYELTPLGKRLAQIPVDPAIARMLLQAREEGVLEDVLVIASGLSVPDPRERPAEAATEADAAHRTFRHPDSDFLSLLNIWNAFHDELERLSQSKLRKFCAAHFLSFQRMREWRDIHSQLERILGERAITKGKPTSAKPHPAERDYEAIHRSILAGLLSNIGRKEEGHLYRGPRNRKALLFPGSGLFDKKAEKPRQRHPQGGKPKPIKTRAPEWIVCAEWMETSRLFARTAAGIQVEWIEAVAGDLLQVKYSEPFWSSKQAAALCKQRKMLFGIEVRLSHVSYTSIDPDTATEIFVRSGLVERGIHERPEFLEHNERVRRRAESEYARLRKGSASVVDDSLHTFYRRRLEGVGSFAELRSFAKRRHGGRLDFLQAELADLVPAEMLHASGDAFPQALDLGGVKFDLEYRHAPGNDSDGVTLSVPIAQLAALDAGQLDWAVPGHLSAKIESMLRTLPKNIRKQLHPLKERSEAIATQLRPDGRPLKEALAGLLRERFQIHTRGDDWARATIPEHLKPRIRVEDARGETIDADRNIDELRTRLDRKADRLESIPAWQAAVQKYERSDLQGWHLECPETPLNLAAEAGVPLLAWPALERKGDAVHLRLFRHESEAKEANREGWCALCARAMGKDIAWLERDLKELKRLGLDLPQLGSFEQVRGQALGHLFRHLFLTAGHWPLDRKRFEQSLRSAAERQRGLVMQLVDRLEVLLGVRSEIEAMLERKQSKQFLVYPGMRRQLQRIAPPDLLDHYEFDMLPDITRFLSAMIMRAERARENVQRDVERAAQVEPWEDQYRALASRVRNADHRETLRECRLLIEEFRVSIFAQTIGTGRKVSAKRLTRLFDDVRSRFDDA